MGIAGDISYTTERALLGERGRKMPSCSGPQYTTKWALGAIGGKSCIIVWGLNIVQKGHFGASGIYIYSERCPFVKSRGLSILQ